MALPRGSAAPPVRRGADGSVRTSLPTSGGRLPALPHALRPVGQECPCGVEASEGLGAFGVGRLGAGPFGDPPADGISPTAAGDVEEAGGDRRRTGGGARRGHRPRRGRPTPPGAPPRLPGVDHDRRGWPARLRRLDPPPRIESRPTAAAGSGRGDRLTESLLLDGLVHLSVMPDGTLTRSSPSARRLNDTAPVGGIVCVNGPSRPKSERFIPVRLEPPAAALASRQPRLGGGDRSGQKRARGRTQGRGQGRHKQSSGNRWSRPAAMDRASRSRRPCRCSCTVRSQAKL